MAAIFPKLCRYAPHLLEVRAFNFSNQHFSLSQNSKVAVFSHHCPLIPTKSPPFPHLSFLPQNLPFSHFSLMASSVARMPSDEWRHHKPSRLHVRTHIPLAKVLTTISTSVNPSAAATAASAALVGGELLSPATAAKRQQSQILDRWVARQARGMATTIERQAHEAELSELSTTTQPVSARAASFLRETSPDSSVVAAVGGGGVVAADILPTVRASSLIQMWRELEAEAGVCPTPRTAVTATPPAVSPENHPDGSDAREVAQAFCGWENAASPSSTSSSSPVSGIIEKRKVGDIVRMLSLQILSSTTSSGDESDSTSKEITANAPAAARSPSQSPTPVTSGKVLPLRRRRETEKFILKLEAERRREVAALAERHLVSRFPFRGRIQSLIRLRSLRQEVAAIKHQQWSQKFEAETFETQSNNFFSRKRPEDKSQHDINGVPNEESSTFMEVQPSNSVFSVFAIPIDASESKNNNFSELLASSREIESSPQACFTPLSRYEDLRGSPSSDASWDERSLWGSSVDWQRPSQPSDSCRGWGVIRRSFYNDLLNTSFIENGEIQELLEMKTVSTSLASEFSAKMNQMIATFLHRQGQQHADGREECEEQGIWRSNYESSSDQTSSPQLLSSEMSHDRESWQNTSSSFSSQILQNQERWQSISLPLPSQMLQKQKSWQSSSSIQNSSPSVQEGEYMHNLKYSVSQIHREISELKKLVQSCVDWQKRMDISIKQEVFSAVNQLGRKDTCCICCEAQTDTLLYRCGHMCACYKCAQELQWSSGRCPICRSLIADVIRAYRNS